MAASRASMEENDFRIRRKYPSMSSRSALRPELDLAGSFVEIED
jgi:hypothetical protein